MYDQEALAAMDADTLEREVLAVIGEKYSNQESLAYQTTFNLNMALWLFEEYPDITPSVSIYLNLPDMSGAVFLEYLNKSGTDFPILFSFNKFGRDECLAVCRAFLYAYHNQDKE